VYNTPNDQSLPGYLKMGWELVGRIPVRVRVHHPLRFVATIGPRRGSEDLGAPPASHAPPAVVALEHPGLPDLLANLDRGLGIRTPIDRDFLRWRYGAVPLLDYRAITIEHRGGLKGLAIFRVRNRGRRWESTVSDVLVGSGDVGTA